MIVSPFALLAEFAEMLLVDTQNPVPETLTDKLFVSPCALTVIFCSTDLPMAVIPRS